MSLRSSLFAIILVLIVVGPIHSDDPEFPWPDSLGQSWKIGFAPLEGAGTQDGSLNRFTRENTMVQLRELLLDLPSRVLSPEERELLQIQSQDYYRNQRAQSLTQSRRAYDQGWIRELDEAQLERLQLALLDSEDQYRRVLEAPDESFEVPETLPLEWVSQNQEQVLFSIDEKEVQSLVDDEDLDGLIYGEVAQRGEYWVVQLSLYLAHDGSTLSLDPVVALEPELNPRLARTRPALEQALSGRSWARLNINVEPPQGSVFVNGEYLGSGDQELRYLEEETYLIRVEAENYHSQTRELVGNKAVPQALDIALEPYEMRPLLIETEVPGAQVFDGGVPLGVTPRLVLVPNAPHMLRLEQEGYVPRDILIGPQSPDSIRVPLLSDQFDWDVEISRAQDRVYGALGGFVLSLLGTMILDGLTQGRINGLETNQLQGDQSESDGFLLQTQALDWARVTSVGLTATLGVNLIVEVVSMLGLVESQASLEY